MREKPYSTGPTAFRICIAADSTLPATTCVHSCFVAIRSLILVDIITHARNRIEAISNGVKAGREFDDGGNAVARDCAALILNNLER
ncbi:hypothetical protein ASC96_12115 [Rhizobium sp. Root1204]|nr:hypothetical protein ASC96_12115 [Rhizobium sp. Root1204]